MTKISHLKREMLLGLLNLSATNDKEYLKSASDSELCKAILDEWDIEKVNRDGSDTVCLCGTPIVTKVHMINKINENKAIIGSICCELFGSSNYNTILHDLQHESDAKENPGKKKRYKPTYMTCSECKKIIKISDNTNHLQTNHPAAYRQLQQEKEKAHRIALNRELQCRLKTKMTFGKYKGKTFGEIQNLNNTYLPWLARDVEETFWNRDMVNNAKFILQNK